MKLRFDETADGCLKIEV